MSRMGFDDFLEKAEVIDKGGGLGYNGVVKGTVSG
jgi:hypothetical protein